MPRTSTHLSLLALGLVGSGLLAREADFVSLRAQQDLVSVRQELGLDADHDLKIRHSHRDHLGQTHTRLQQYFQGVKVWGGELVAHTDAQGRKLDRSGEVSSVIRLFAKPVLTEKEALAIADADLGPKKDYAYEPTVELVVYPVTTQTVKAERASLRAELRSATDYTRQVLNHVLAYHVHTQLENGADETRHTDYMVDAHTGAIITKWDTLHTTASVATGKSQFSGTVSLNTNQNGSTYELSDVVGSMPIKTYNLNHATSGTGTLYTDADNTWGDGANYISGGSTTAANGQTAAVDAHFGIMSTSAFYKNVLGRNGIDGNGKATYSRVHYSSAYDNAYWDDTCFCMTYGDGSSFKSLEALDVAGHEMSHGVCASTANLDYSGESGGLNEANSDIFGTFVTFYTYGGGTGATVPNTIPSANLHGYTPWTIGSQLSSTPLRYMYKPSKDGSSPDAWSSSLGNLDVHYSSGPMNRAAYFLSQGATTSGDTSTSYLPSGMTGIGNDKAAKIWYRALTVYLTSSSNYAAARTAVINAAKDLYGAGGVEEQASWNAFHGINVGSAWASSSAVSVTLSPTTASVQTGGTTTFKATVAGSTNTAVTWSVVESGGGSITSGGVYTAPATAGTYHVKATSQADASASATATVTVSGSGGSATELILNGGFESTTTGWSGTTGDIGTWSQQAPYQGSAYAWLLGNGKTATETLYQKVTIPSTVTSATLSFYLHVDTAETGSTAYDKLAVSLLNSTGSSTLKTLATYSNVDKNTGYTLRSFDVSAYKGQTIRVYFKGTEDSSLQTSFVIDNVSLSTK